MAITTRSGKGSQLTWAEMDTNLSELDTRTAIKWQNLRSETTTEGLSNAPPLRLFNSTLYMRAFSADVEQEISAIFHMTKDYIPGSDLYPHGHVVSPTASTGVVRWGFTFSYANETDAYSTPVTAYVEQTVSATDQNKHILVETPVPLSIATLDPDSIILMRIFRDATHINDTYPDEMYLSLVDLYYQSQGFGEAIR